MSDFKSDNKWATETIQPIAERLFYSKLWPDCRIIHLDNDQTDILKRAMDIAGCDKVIVHPDKKISLLAQRFRSYKFSKYDDFTLRYSRPLGGQGTEFTKTITALNENCMIAAYYAYGHVNEAEDGFVRFRILHFLEFVKRCAAGQLEKPVIKANTDGSSRFAVWKFSSIPADLFFFKYP